MIKTRVAIARLLHRRTFNTKWACAFCWEKKLSQKLYVKRREVNARQLIKNSFLWKWKFSSLSCLIFFSFFRLVCRLSRREGKLKLRAFRTIYSHEHTHYTALGEERGERNLCHANKLRVAGYLAVREIRREKAWKIQTIIARISFHRFLHTNHLKIT